MSISANLHGNSHKLGKTARGTNKRHEPKEGTKLRRLWDLLLAHPGRAVELPAPGRGQGNRRMIDDLQDYYGLEIIRGTSRNSWILKGRWIGSAYHAFSERTVLPDR